MADLPGYISDTELYYGEDVGLACDAGADVTGDIGEVLTRDDSDATGGAGPLTYAWTVESGPGTATWEATTTLHPWLFVNLAGTYVIRLTVTDGVDTVWDGWCRATRSAARGPT
jgi:hypothetical protein